MAHQHHLKDVCFSILLLNIFCLNIMDVTFFDFLGFVFVMRSKLLILHLYLYAVCLFELSTIGIVFS